MSNSKPILVTGAASGAVGSVGSQIVHLLRGKNIPVRAFVHHNDARCKELRDLGAEIFVGDLCNTKDVVAAVRGCRRVYFGMAVNDRYLEGTTIMAAACREVTGIELLVNISQLTVSQMSLQEQTDSLQQRLHFLAEQVLNWSGLPVVHVRATAFLQTFFFTEWAAASIAKDGTIRLPFGTGKTSPISSRDVAEVVSVILSEPNPFKYGKIVELTGPQSLNMTEVAAAYSEALKRPVKYIDLPFDEWRNCYLEDSGLDPHVKKHLATMAQLHHEGRYDRWTDDVRRITGHAALSVKEYAASQEFAAKVESYSNTRSNRD